MVVRIERLGGDQREQEIVLSSPAELNNVILRYFELAMRKVIVRAPRLELEVFRSLELVDAINHFVTIDVRNQVLMLVEDELHFLRRNARLLALIRRHSSYLQVRKVTDEYADGQELFVVADETAWCRQPRSDHRQFAFNANNAAMAKRLQRRFDEVWERSDAMPEVFSLGL